MATEIELKYLVNSDKVESIISTLLTEQSIPHQVASKQLKNTYFDTSNLALRHLDMGLRVRWYAAFIEQTIKTAGVVVGGLHQRPEYNVNIESNTPDLSLFPHEIWPSSENIEQLQSDLIPLFSTNFERATWLVELPEGTVELAYDRGDISSGNLVEQINEIELELVSGDISAIFSLANLLFDQLEVRAGRKSKAARGYGLWHKSLATSADNNDKDHTIGFTDKRYLLAPIIAEQNTIEAFYCGVEFGLAQIQENINAYIDNPRLTHLFLLTDAMKFLRYGIHQFQSVLHLPKYQPITQLLDTLIEQFNWLDKAQHVRELTTKKGNYRKKIEYNKQLIELLRLKRERFPTVESVISQLQSGSFNKLQLQLLELLINPVASSEQPNLHKFAYLALEQSLKDLISATPECDAMSASQYLALNQYLTKSLITGCWFGGLYSKEMRKEYRSPWLDILHGIDELAIYALLQRQLQQLEQQPDKLIRWLECKIDNLVDVLEHSRKVAISVNPYWHVA